MGDIIQIEVLMKFQERVYGFTRELSAELLSDTLVTLRRKVKQMQQSTNTTRFRTYVTSYRNKFDSGKNLSFSSAARGMRMLCQL